MNLPKLIPAHDVEFQQVGGASQFGPGAHGAGFEDRLDFGALKSIFLRRLGLASVIFLGIFLVAAVKAFSTPKQYTAHAEVVLNTRGEATPDVLEEGGEVLRGEAELSTELRILYSRELALTVVEDLDLVYDSEFNPLLRAASGPPSFVERLLGAKESSAPPPSDEELENSKILVADYLRSGLKATRVGNTYSIHISYNHSNPYRAAQMANAFADAYVRDQLTRKQQSSRGNADFLNFRIEELRQQAQTDQDRVQRFRIENNMLSMTGATLTEQDISALNQQLAQAKAIAAEDAARLATARQRLAIGSPGDDVGDVLASGLVQSLRAQRAAISVRVADLRGRYGPEHPELKKGELELQDIDDQIQTEINRIISGLEGKFNVSRQRVDSLTASLNDLKRDLADNNVASVELDDLERRARASQALYESFLNSYKETVAREGVQKADARVITAARIPPAPSKPNIPLSLFFAVVFGGTVAAATAFVAEMAFGGITSLEEGERKLHLPAMGAVPLNRTVSPRSGNVLKSLAKHPYAPLSESLLGIMTAINFKLESQDPHVIYVTSAVPDEGKTTLAAALGVTAARAGTRVIVVDCDRMKRDLSLRFGADQGIGVADVLQGRASLDEAIVKGAEGKPDILNNNESSKENKRSADESKFRAIIADLRKKYDLIILDGAPVLPFSESRKLCGHADMVLFAIHWRKTRVGTVRQALKTLPNESLEATGIVLTQVNAKLQRRFGVEETLAYSSRYVRRYIS